MFPAYADNHARILKRADAAPVQQLSDSVRKKALEDISGYEKLVQLNWDGDNTLHYVGPYDRSKGLAIPVYDDRDNSNTWLPWSTERYEDWVKTLKGHPTLGYGTRYDLLTDEQRNQYIDSYGEPTIDWIRGLRDGKLQEIMADVLARHPNFTKDFNDDQQASLASFYYNAGQSPKNKETIEKAVHAGDVNGVYEALPLYNKADGAVQDGLVTRRENERQAFKPAGTVETQPVHHVQVQQPVQPAPAQQQQPEQPQAQAPVKYKVKPGDSVWSIWNGTGRSKPWHEFSKDFTTKNQHIADPGKLTVGTEYQLP